MSTKKKVIDTRHPEYTLNASNWLKWRLTYEGGTPFIHKYLRRMGKRETFEDFRDRKAVTYCPAFSKAAINEIKNSIFQRTCDITRAGGSQTYQDAIAGNSNGVDLKGSSMNSFLGRKIIHELLSMGKVGIYVDMPRLSGPTKKDIRGKRPYLYWYRAEDILSWACEDSENPTEITNLLLGDCVIDNDEDSFLPYTEIKRYRHLWIDPDTGFVNVQFYDETGDIGDENPIQLEITKIPFHMLELSDSLLTDVADYQIALLNMESADVAYAIKGNFPFYIEQYDPRVGNPYAKSMPPNSVNLNEYNVTTQTVVNSQNIEEIKVGTSSGRRYPIGTHAPAFINPSSETLKVSMEKEAQLKADIRNLVNLSLINLQPRNELSPLAGDPQGLEAGLSYIGLELEYAERRIAEFWAMYESGTPATVNYPENYSLVSDEERRQRADQLQQMLPQLPSKTYQREVAKQMAVILLGTKVSNAKLKQIMAEIDSAEVIITDPQVIQTDFESGFVGLDLASQARGYPKGEVEKAKTDHAERAARIAISQSKAGGFGATANLTDPQARGVNDLSTNPNASNEEKAKAADPTLNPDPKQPATRGEGK